VATHINNDPTPIAAIAAAIGQALLPSRWPTAAPSSADSGTDGWLLDKDFWLRRTYASEYR
jgi:hypothetical protein